MGKKVVVSMWDLSDKLVPPGTQVVQTRSLTVEELDKELDARERARSEKSSQKDS